MIGTLIIWLVVAAVTAAAIALAQWAHPERYDTRRRQGHDD
jgi:hypothetical protein